MTAENGSDGATTPTNNGTQSPAAAYRKTNGKANGSFSAEATQLAADLDALFATPVAPDAALDPAAVVAESREAADGCDPTVATPILEPVSVPFARQPGGEKGPLAEVSAPPPPPKEKTPLCGACFRPATATV